MPEYDDYELNPENRSEEPELKNPAWVPVDADERVKGPKRLLVIILLIAVLLGIFGAWWWWRSFKAAAGIEEPIPTTHAERPVVPALQPTGENPEDLERVTLSNSDDLLRKAVSALSANPRLAAWLVNEGLIERFVKVTGNVAYGEDPKSHVPFLRPGRSFSTQEQGGKLVISPQSYARYTPYIEVLESLDTEGTGVLFRRFLPAMEVAFSELGYPGTFRETLDRAVANTLAVEVPTGEIEVVESVLSYRFADPTIEGSPDFDKLLFRMGPANQRRLRSEVRRLAGAL